MTKKERDTRLSRDNTAKSVYTDIENDGRLVIANPANLITIANNLLLSDDWDELAIGILATTGRRPIEVLNIGTFTATDTNTCLFTGQAKTIDSKKKIEGYSIYTLAPASLVENAFKKLRNIKKLNHLNNRQIESRTSGKLGVTVRDHLDTALEIEGLITPKSLRGIWVNIAHHLFKPRSIDTVFATAQLGHATSSGAKSSAASENYMQFYAYPFNRDEINDIMTIIS
jgi:integrase